MLFKNNLQPEAATAFGPSSHGTSMRSSYNSVQFDAGETDEFNAFQAGSGRGDMNRRPQRPQQPHHPQRRKKQNSRNLILMGVVAAVVVILIAVLTVAIVINAGNKNLTYENNSYIVYTDEKDGYHVLVNGDEIEYEFEGEVTLTASADRSFAYLVDSGSEGVQVYILDGKKLEKVTPAPVDEVLAFAQLEPGVIYRHNQSYRVYSEKGGEQQIVKQSKDPQNFLISGDASTVIYSATEDKGENSYDYLYIFAEGISRRAVKSCTPVAISNYGDYIYGYMLNANQNVKELYCIDPEDLENPVKIKNTYGYDETIAPILNLKGDEILYYISNGSEFTTMLYRAKKDANTTVGAGILTFAQVDPQVAVYGKFKDTYLMGENPASDTSPFSTYYITKDYKGDQVSKFAGKFSPDGDYFYYINNDGTLMQMDLTDDKRPKKSTNHEDIIDFVITEKGNLYTLDDSQQLRFYKVSSGKTSAISYDATEISLYHYANTIFFAEEESEDVNVWISEEGSKQEEATMDKIDITQIPSFSNPHGKKSFAYYYDTEHGWQLYYTANGKSFDLISDQCSTIFVDGMEISDND